MWLMLQIMQEKKEIEQNFFKHTTFSLAYE